MNLLKLLLSLVLCATVLSCTSNIKSNPKTTRLSTLRTPNISNDSIPEPIGYVNDFEHIFSNEQIFHLDSLISDFEDSTTIQIAIVTLDSTFTTKENFYDYTLALGRKWGVGQKGKNNGIVIGVSLSLRIIRIQNGYGIEKIFTDLETKNVIDNDMIPYFRKAEIFEGILNGLQKIMATLKPRNK